MVCCFSLGRGAFSQEVKVQDVLGIWLELLRRRALSGFPPPPFLSLQLAGEIAREGLARVVSGDDIGFRADFNSGLIIFYKNRHPVGEMQAILRLESNFVQGQRVTGPGRAGRAGEREKEN